MTGTRAGGLKCAKTNKELYGDDYYSRLGKKGGKVTGLMKGFAANRELASKAGRKGGLISRRGKSKVV